MIEAAAIALGNVFASDIMIYIVVGVLVGLVVGILPGLGGVVGMSLLLPFIFGMEPAQGIALLIGMAAITQTSDTFPSVLLGIPGSAASQATVLDGYPMARQGKAATALGAAFFVSMVGGLIGAVFLFAALGAATPLMRSLGSPELFMLALLGLSMVGILARGAALAGIISGFFGLVLGAVGAAPATGQARLTHGFFYLYDGIPFAVVALGLFAIPELLELLTENRQIAKFGKLHGSVFSGVREALKHKALIVRSALIGAVIGFIPGVGGSVIDWITYGIAAQTSRDNENFGKGDIRGVIAPESANNAKEGGTLIPTLLFGIPGSGTTAVLLGGLLMMGVQVGPSMLTTNLSLTMTIVWSLAIANVVGATLCMVLAEPVSRLTLIDPKRLVPFLLIIVTAAAYQSSRNWGDLVTLVGVGAIGYAMKRLDWPRPPMLVGFVLSISAERYLHLSRSRYGLDWIYRPGVRFVFLLICLLIATGIYLDASRQKRQRAATTTVVPVREEQ